MGRKIILISILAACFIAAGATGLIYWHSQKMTVAIPYGSPALWDRLLAEPGVINVPESTRAVIIPHHLITATELTKFYRGIAAQFQPKLIFLAGPNHYEEGEADIQTCNCSYSTIKGRLDTNTEALNKILSGRWAEPNNEAFKKEHSMYAHATFIKNFFPDAKIVPLILKWKTPDEEIDRLTTFINSITNSKDVLLIGSVDFSHYLPVLAADFHDQSSFDAIRNFDEDRIRSIEIDSAATVRLVTGWAKQKGLMDVSLLGHTNSQQFFLEKKLEQTTSHEYITFSKGELEKTSQISLHFFGDVMFGRKIAPHLATGNLLSEIAGEEERFFQGNDYNVLNLEGVLGRQTQGQKKPVTFQFDPEEVLSLLKKFSFNAVNLANNHILDYFSAADTETRVRLTKAGILSFGDYEMGSNTCSTVQKNDLKIALCGLNDAGKVLQVSASLRMIAKAKKEHDLVFLNVHWGEEYNALPTTRQKDLARKFIENGADLIIGHHPHVIQPMEVIKGKPVFYSLGNFIFDQNQPEGVETGLSVGVMATTKKITLYLFPFHTNEGRPALLDNEETEVFFMHFLSKIGPYKTELLGKLEINLPPE